MYYVRITCGPDCEIFFFGFTVGGRHDWVIDCRTSTRSSRVEDITTAAWFPPNIFPRHFRNQEVTGLGSTHDEDTFQ